MTLVDHALRAARTTDAPALAAPPVALLIGGGGALGSAVLERLLGHAAHGSAARSSAGAPSRALVRVLVRQRLDSAHAGLEPVLVDGDAFACAPARPTGDDPAAGVRAPLADIALVVFDRERHANGREAAFVRPSPDALPALARWLRVHGVRSLVVVMPHAPASLPLALQRGLADLDEHAVAAAGFDGLVFVRSAQASGPRGPARRSAPQRLADGVLAQMRMMVAPIHQPVRASKVAQFVVELARQVADRRGASGTRIAPPELVWQSAQMRDPAPLVQAWLEDRELPPLVAPRRRF